MCKPERRRSKAWTRNCSLHMWNSNLDNHPQEDSLNCAREISAHTITHTGHRDCRTPFSVLRKQFYTSAWSSQKEGVGQTPCACPPCAWGRGAVHSTGKWFSFLFLCRCLSMQCSEGYKWCTLCTHFFLLGVRVYLPCAYHVSFWIRVICLVHTM
jgi:hypothetical protein